MVRVKSLQNKAARFSHGNSCMRQSAHIPAHRLIAEPTAPPHLALCPRLWDLEPDIGPPARPAISMQVHRSLVPAERSAARLAHQSGGLGVPSSNLGAPTNKISKLCRAPTSAVPAVGPPWVQRCGPPNWRRSTMYYRKLSPFISPVLVGCMFLGGQTGLLKGQALGDVHLITDAPLVTVAVSTASGAAPSSARFCHVRNAGRALLVTCRLRAAQHGLRPSPPRIAAMGRVSYGSAA
jgi:hypothetical protein